MRKNILLLLIPVLILAAFGLFMIYDASSYVAFKDFGDKYHYIKEQISWTIIGAVGMVFFYLFDYRKLYNLSLPILLVAVLFLTLVFAPGLGVYTLGAHRWVNFKLFVLQPSELAKLALSIYLAAWFSSKEKGRLLAFLLLLVLVIALIIAEPDMGTAAIILVQAMFIYFLSGAPLWQFIGLGPILGVLGLIAIKISSYRSQRLSTFFDLNKDPQNMSYHVRQILIALGSGGLTGVGLGNSLQKYAYLPENTTDSIFAIIAEETGFLGSIILVALFVVVIIAAFRIALKAKDNFGRLLAGGIAISIATQALVNLASQTALIPLTGVPLPFVSYGGSALIINLCSIGILLNIAKQEK